ncbi:MAG: hypothetical protein NC417_02700 [Candidatus Gastranaerophilales bacterium]|nr:hypothetical protein [Candidatus Gastranaerophilales bacterium]
MSGWILLLLLFCGGFGNDNGCGNNNGCQGGRSGRDGRNGRGRDRSDCGCGRDGGRDREDSCGCGRDGQPRGGNAIPAAWSDCGCDDEPRPFSGRPDFPSVGDSENCGCDHND